MVVLVLVKEWKMEPAVAVVMGRHEVLKNNKTGARRDDWLLWLRVEQSG